ncbi:hypothetical protein Barb7_03032 [Bacteroidales bacterium Barb7]|nr:hypothetical protein Barb7_03032 [Bacteroidales bacterium Barb7]
MKSSCERDQAADTDGKVPHLWFAPNLEEPSRRTVAASIYFSA